MRRLRNGLRLSTAGWMSKKLNGKVKSKNTQNKLKVRINNMKEMMIKHLGLNRDIDWLKSIFNESEENKMYFMISTRGTNKKDSNVKMAMKEMVNEMYIIKRNRLTGDYTVTVSESKCITIKDLMFGVYEFYIYENVDDFTKKLDELENEVKFYAR
jgi:hypothetical protein